MLNELSDVKDKLHVGAKLFITTEPSAETLEVSIAAICSREIAFTIPIKKGVYLPLAKNTKIEVCFYKNTGQYLFKTVVLRRILFDGKPVIICAMPPSLIKAERRKLCRVNTFFPVKITVLNTNEGELAGDTYNVHYINISGGGIQIDREDSKIIPLKLDNVVNIDFCGAFKMTGKTQGIVVRTPEKGKAGWGIKFTKISRYDRDKIMNYVLKKQLMNAKGNQSKQEE